MRKIILLVCLMLFLNVYGSETKTTPQPGVDALYSPDDLTVPDSALKLMREIQKGDDTVQVVYYKSGTIYSVSKMPMSFQKLNKKYFKELTEDSFESTANIFCTLKEKASETWKIIASYDYVYDVVSIENIWVGRITADPKKIICPNLSSK